MDYFLITTFNFLNNTFFGTLLAGMILVFFALFQYKKQKTIDNKNADFLKIREVSSDLYSQIVSNSKLLLNILEDENVKKIYSIATSKFGQDFFNLQNKEAIERGKEFNSKKDLLFLLLKMYYIDINKEFPHKELEEKLSSLGAYISLGAATLGLDIENSKEVASEIRKNYHSSEEEIKKIYKKFKL